ncbi:MAG: hypothetical protein R3D46_06225 [Defluviimonas denitrificans]
MTDIRTKKLINAPEDLIAEAIEGMVAAHPDMLVVEGATGARWSPSMARARARWAS